jgi:hypothetical protein
MKRSDKSLRQIIILINSVSRSGASMEEIQWVRREVAAYLMKVLTLGLYPA